MPRTISKDRMDKVRKRLFQSKSDSVQLIGVVCKDNKSVQHTSSMAQKLVAQNTRKDKVYFLGYRHPRYICGEHYCANCISDIVGYKIDSTNDKDYLNYWETLLSEFTEFDYNTPYNYCGTCKDPLYSLKKIKCALSSPTSSKLLKHFQKRRQDGPRDGGI